MIQSLPPTKRDIIRTVNIGASLFQFIQKYFAALQGDNGVNAVFASEREFTAVFQTGGLPGGSVHDWTD